MMELRCPCCGGLPEVGRRKGILINAALSLSSDIVMVEAMLATLPKKGAELIREAYEGRLARLRADRSALEEMCSENG